MRPIRYNEETAASLVVLRPAASLRWSVILSEKARKPAWFHTQIIGRGRAVSPSHRRRAVGVE